MKSAVLKSYKKFSWEERQISDPENSEIQVRITFASICGTDMHIFNGDFHPRTPVPFVPGHEMAGIVEQTGSDVCTFSKGEKVVIDPIIWCGECPACKSGHFPACESLKLVGIDMDGGFSQFINVDQSMVFKADPKVKNEHLALTEIYAIGFHACRRAEVKSGESISIWGAGRVGQVILQAAKTITDGMIIMVDVVDSRLKIASDSYKDVITVNPLKEDPIKIIQEHTGGTGTDLAFEAVGHPKFADQTINPVRGAIQSIKGGGRICVLGLSGEPAPIIFKELIWKEARIIASRVSHGEYPKVLESLAKGILKPDALISDIMPAEKIQEAFEKMEREPESNLKILLDFNNIKEQK